MGEYEAKTYQRYYQSIVKEVSRIFFWGATKHADTTKVNELKVILAGLEAKGDDREWLRNQSIGDLDDHKLVESLTGEQNVYKRRGKQEHRAGIQVSPDDGDRCSSRSTGASKAISFCYGSEWLYVSV